MSLKKFKQVFVHLLIPISLFSNQKNIKSDILEDFIKRICIETFNSEMAMAETTPPAGMEDFTCNCFILEIDKAASVASAQETCKEKAVKRFNL